jgi:hypothetical protein
VFKIASAPILKAACFAALGVPVNSYFLASAFVGYQKNMSLFLSTPELNYALAEIDQLSEQKMSIFYALLFFPLGLQLTELKFAMTKFFGLVN